MSARARVIAAAGLLVALFAVGIVWLLVRAAGGPGTAPAALDGAASSTEATVPTEAPSTGESAPEQPAQPSTQDPGGGPPRPPRSALVAGARLDGALDGTCAFISYSEAKTSVRVDDVAVKSDLPGLARNDPGGCPGQRTVPACQGFAFTPDAQTCTVGVAVPAGTQPGSYSAVVRLALRVRCTSAEPAPCDQVGAPTPTEAQPVDAKFVGEGPSVELTVDAPETAGPTGQADTAGSTETAGATETASPTP